MNRFSYRGHYERAEADLEKAKNQIAELSKSLEYMKEREAKRIEYIQDLQSKLDAPKKTDQLEASVRLLEKKLAGAQNACAKHVETIDDLRAQLIHKRNSTAAKDMLDVQAW